MGNFGDVMKALGLLILHTAEQAAENPDVQAAIVTMVVASVKANQAKK